MQNMALVTESNNTTTLSLINLMTKEAVYTEELGNGQVDVFETE
jgi:hypothetical protein